MYRVLRAQKSTDCFPLSRSALMEGTGMATGSASGLSVRPSAEYGVALADQDARGWLARRGHDAVPVGTFRLFADAVTSGSFGFARIWHSAATWRKAEAQSEPADAITIMVLVEGSVTVNYRGESYSLGANEATFLCAGDDYSIEAQEASARIEILLDQSFWVGYDIKSEQVRGVPIPASGYTRLLVASANTALGINLLPEGVAAASLRRSFEYLALAALRDREAMRGSRAMSTHEQIYTDALSVIEASAERPTLTVQSLAAELKLSVRQLQRAFADEGASPLAEIRARRLRRVEELLKDRPARSRRDMAEVARASGFKTTRAMLAALRSGSESGSASAE
jgi:AraC-like DNA-binding protein